MECQDENRHAWLSSRADPVVLCQRAAVKMNAGGKLDDARPGVQKPVWYVDWTGDSRPTINRCWAPPLGPRRLPLG
jgi:hypothetical protein